MVERFLTVIFKRNRLSIECSDYVAVCRFLWRPWQVKRSRWRLKHWTPLEMLRLKYKTKKAFLRTSSVWFLQASFFSFFTLNLSHVFWCAQDENKRFANPSFLSSCFSYCCIVFNKFFCFLVVFFCYPDCLQVNNSKMVALCRTTTFGRSLLFTSFCVFVAAKINWLIWRQIRNDGIFFERLIEIFKFHLCLKKRKKEKTILLCLSLLTKH